ncbi:hypothetical protein GCM10009565_38940 [Amycolatopsis albidoflavus]
MVSNGFVDAALATGCGPIESSEPGALPCGSFEHAGPNTSAFVVTPSPEEAPLDIGADIELDIGAGALLELPLPDELSLPLHAVRVSAAAAVRPTPATRNLFTMIHSCLSGGSSPSELPDAGHSERLPERMGRCSENPIG